LCSSAGECFLNFIDYGLRLGGGIGDVIPRTSYKFNESGSPNYFYPRLIINTLFHILVNLILQNIFFGIIVDTFTEFRDESNQKDEDKRNKCIMCNRDRYNNIKPGEDFDQHRTLDHHVFNYVYFVCYLLRKNPQEYSRAEEFAWNQINLRRMEWYPGNIELDKHLNSNKSD